MQRKTIESITVHKCCNTDVLGVLLIYLYSPSGAACPRDHAYISVKPLAAMLQPINVCVYVCVTRPEKTGLIYIKP